MIMQNIDSWIPSVFYFLGGILLGLVIELIIFARFRRSLSRVKWKGFTIISNSLRGIPFFWFLLLGSYLAIIYIPADVLNLDPTFIDLIARGFFLIFILTFLAILAKMTNGFITHYSGRTEGALASTTLVTNIVNLIFILLGFLIIIQSLGIDITPLLTLLGVGGLTVALALQPTLSNFFSGIYLIAAKEFSVGDFIRLDTGEEGYIVDMTWRHTVIRPPAQYDIIIPNLRLASASVTNFGISSNEIQITVPLGVGYESDLEYVEKVTIEVAIQAVEQVQGEKPTTLPYIRYHTFSPSSIDFNVNIYSKNLRDRAKIRHEFIKLLYKRYKSEGIDIPYPTTIVLSKPLT